MNTKLTILVIFVCLSGCLTNQPGQVVVEEKSFNFVETESQQSKTQSKKTNVKKNWSLPVKSSILKKYSAQDGHFGLTFDNAAGQEVRAVR